MTTLLRAAAIVTGLLTFEYTAYAQTAEQIDNFCVQTAMKNLGPAANRVTDIKVQRQAPPGYDHDQKPGFLRFLVIETTIGTFKSQQNWRCGAPTGKIYAVPD